MKVLFLDVSGKGGHAHHIFFMCNALAEIGVDVVLITTKNHELDLSQAKFAYKEILNPHHDKHYGLSKGKTYIFSLIRLIFCVISEKPDIIHLHDFKIPFLEYHLINYFHRRKIKVVCSAHNVLHHEKKAATKYLKKIYNNYDRIIAHAEDNKQRLIQIFEVTPDKIQVIPVGEYSYIAGDIQDKNVARKTLGILPDRKVLLFFGYIRPYKGLKMLLEALFTVRQIIPEVFLIIAGESKEDYSVYEKEINRLGIADIILSVIKYIPVEDMSSYFSAADIVVLPYTNIYQSGILYLAFAYKRPVIATNVGGLPEVVKEEKNGYLVPPNNPQKFAHAIERALSDIQKIEEMGQYAFHQAKEKYSWQSIAEKTALLYKKVLN